MSVTYIATLSVREETVLYPSSLLHAERRRRGTRAGRRSLTCLGTAGGSRFPGGAAGLGEVARVRSTVDLVVGDLTEETVDAIVNAANSSLLGGGGVDGAIHRKGGPAILAECRALRAGDYGGGLRPGQAVATTAGRLAARWVIHTVGPVWSVSEDRSPLLRDCYRNALAVAVDLGARSVAFPLISSGIYRWPKPDAVRQALTAIQAAPVTVDLVRLVLFDAQTSTIAEQVRQELHRPDSAARTNT